MYVFIELRSINTYLGWDSACADLGPQRRFIVYPGMERFPLDADTEAIGVVGLARELKEMK